MNHVVCLFLSFHRLFKILTKNFKFFYLQIKTAWRSIRIQLKLCGLFENETQHGPILMANFHVLGLPKIERQCENKTTLISNFDEVPFTRNTVKQLSVSWFVLTLFSWNSRQRRASGSAIFGMSSTD